jgi:Xaa-Pro aminopeptidase
LNYILTNESSLYHECGYSCDNAIFLKVGSYRYFFTDARYEIESKDLISDCDIIISKNLLLSVKSILRNCRAMSIFFDPKEWNFFQIEYLKQIKKINFRPRVDYFVKKRAIKTDEEIKLLQEAVNLGKSGFDEFADFLKSSSNSSEKFLNYNNKSCMTNFGQFDISFEPIVAINENASKPHALPTSKVLQNDDLILVDAGIKYKRYCSDRTRTSQFGKNIDFSLNQKFDKPKIQKAYDLVLKAHDEAIKKSKIGMKASDIDKIARDIIDNSEFNGTFVHSTGHGVGLDIHEYPYISSKSDMIIEENMVFTIEPGIYIKDEFGIRIEDMVVMTKDGAKVL